MSADLDHKEMGSIAERESEYNDTRNVGKELKEIKDDVMVSRAYKPDTGLDDKAITELSNCNVSRELDEDQMKTIDAYFDRKN